MGDEGLNVVRGVIGLEDLGSDGVTSSPRAAEMSVMKISKQNMRSAHEDHGRCDHLLRTAGDIVGHAREIQSGDGTEALH